MKHDNSKFLVELLHGLTHKQIFFLLWFGIVAIFVMLMISFYRKNTRRNFRGPADGAGPRISVDTRRLGAEGKVSKAVVMHSPSSPVPHQGETVSKGKPPHG